MGYGHVLKCFTHFFVQNHQSVELLNRLGIRKVDVVGDTRFDRVLQIKELAKQLPIVEAFKDGRKVFVVGSSWEPDEDVFVPFMNEHRDWKLIIAPHVIAESHLKTIEQKLQLRTVRYTQTTPEEARDAQCLIIDCFGLLSSVYHYGEVAYVGGGFGAGIHNVLEAAVWGIPVIFGPNNQRFQEAQQLKPVHAGIEITDQTTFATVMSQFMTRPDVLQQCGQAAETFVVERAGATEKILKLIKI